MTQRIHLPSCFNLVIENLIFSSIAHTSKRPPSRVFQSRNRESYLFKGTSKARSRKGCRFQSRNRESYLFKIKKSPEWIDAVKVSIS